MKTIQFFGVAVLSLFLAMAAGVDASAQEDNNRDENNKIVRGAYETNRLFDNIWIGVAGGLNIYENEINDPGPFGGRLGAALDINIGKWITPSVGLRIGYQGLTASAWATEPTWYSSGLNDNGYYKNRFGTAYIHGDVLWNISNAISGYKETRTWNFVPFLSAGYARSYKSGVDWANNELALGFGLLNNIRISNRVDLTLEARQLFLREGYDSGPMGGVAGITSVTFGVAVKLGKTGFKRSRTAEYESNINDLKAMNAALSNEKADVENDKDELEAENAALKAAVKELENKPAVVERIMLDVTPGAVFFEIGQAKLSPQELFHLDFYLKNVIAQDTEKVFTLTGYADRQTGSKKRNQHLSQMRVEYVYNLLKEKYNVPAERLVIKAAGSEVDRWGDPLLNRCVVIE